MRSAEEANARVVGDKDNQQLSDYEAELSLLRRRCQSVQNDHDRYKREVLRLQNALNRARIVRTLTSLLCAPVTPFSVWWGRIFVWCKLWLCFVYDPTFSRVSNLACDDLDNLASIVISLIFQLPGFIEISTFN